MPFKSEKQRKWMHANEPKMAKKWEKESVVSLQENPAAIAAAQAMTRIKMQDPKSGKKVAATSALKNPEHPNHKKAKSMFDKLKDRFSKKKKEPEKEKPQSKSDADFYKRQFGHKEESIIEINGVKYARVEEGFGGELKGKDKEKFEKARKENAEVLGYKLTGKRDIKEY